MTENEKMFTNSVSLNDCFIILVHKKENGDYEVSSFCNTFEFPERSFLTSKIIDGIKELQQRRRDRKIKSEINELKNKIRENIKEIKRKRNKIGK